MKKVAIVVIYLGKFPWYFDFFIDSCINNSTIDFLVFSSIPFQCNERAEVKNIKRVPFSIESFNELASRKLNFEINIENPYKICDFRPAFGVIFEDYLKPYDFWGYSDIDLILGRVREFLSTEILNEYDFISVKPEYPSGYFAMYRNTPVLNHLFTSYGDYKTIFSNQENLLFDECGGFYEEVISGVNILDIKSRFESFFHVLERNRSEIKQLFEFFSIEGTPGKIIYDHGALIYFNQYEVLLYHLSDFKKNIFSRKKKWKEIPPYYFIDKYSFRKKKKFPNPGFAVDNIIKPFFFHFWIRVMSSISLFIRKNIVLEEGVYAYMQDTIVVLNKGGESHIKMKNQHFPVRGILLFNNYFFLKGYSGYFLLERTKNAININRVFPNGNLVAYSKSSRD